MADPIDAMREKVRRQLPDTQWYDWIMEFHRHPPKQVAGSCGQYTYFHHQGLKRKQIPLMGVTKSMSSYLYSYSKHQAYRQRAKKKRARPRKRIGAPPPSPQPASIAPIKHEKGGITGRARGTMIHHHIHDMVYMDEATFKRAHPEGKHKWAENVWKHLKERNWYPIIPEFLVYRLDYYLATRIDLVCVERHSGKILFIELKTGYVDDFIDDLPGHAWTKEIMKNYACSHEKLALVQIDLGVQMALDDLCELSDMPDWPDHVWEAYVVHVFDDVKEPRLTELNKDFFKEHGKVLYDNVGMARRKDVAAKKAARKKPKSIKERRGHAT